MCSTAGASEVPLTILIMQDTSSKLALGYKLWKVSTSQYIMLYHFINISSCIPRQYFHYGNGIDLLQTVGLVYDINMFIHYARTSVVYI
jgi:hypothetical protein